MIPPKIKWPTMNTGGRRRIVAYIASSPVGVLVLDPFLVDMGVTEKQAIANFIAANPLPFVAFLGVMGFLYHHYHTNPSDPKQ